MASARSHNASRGVSEGHPLHEAVADPRLRGHSPTLAQMSAPSSDAHGRLHRVSRCASSQSTVVTTVEFTYDEVVLLYGGLVEASEALSADEFRARVGRSEADAEALRTVVRRLESGLTDQNLTGHS